MTIQERTVQERTIRVLVADDQTIVRKGTCALLDLIEDMEIVGEATNGIEAVALAEALHPDVVLMDLVMPECDGVEATQLITAAHPDIHIIVLTSFGPDDRLLLAVRAGALGYLLKATDPEELVEAIREVARGGGWLPPDLTRRVLNEFSHPTPVQSSPDPLTNRELHVLKQVALGRTNAQMAGEMGISEITVRTHVSHILDKLQCENRVQAALYALRTGIAALDGGSVGMHQT
jgi:DNA-binding NarL/FixJ family response regulator